MLAETLALVVDAEVLARIGGPIGDAARERAREIAALDAAASRAKRATWMASARVPIPAGLRGIDASWIDAAIARASSVEDRHDGRREEARREEARRDERGAVRAIATRMRSVLAGDTTSAVDVWLARWACASFPPMPAIQPSVVRPRSVIEALAMSAANLRAWLEEVGADQIAFAIGKSATAVSTRLGAAAERIARAPRLGELGERRSAIERARIAMDETALLRVGARTIAAHLGHLERAQLAHRLPRKTGVWAELEAFAGSAGAPSWRALSAP